MNRPALLALLILTVLGYCLWSIHKLPSTPPPSEARSSEEGLAGNPINESTDVIEQDLPDVPPGLRRYNILRNKPLQSAHDLSEIQGYRRDVRWLRFAAETLRTANSNHTEAIRYLVDAMSWKKNPSREIAQQEIERFVLSPKSNPQSDSAKIELFVELIRRDQNRAQQVFELSQDTNNKKLMKYAFNYQTRFENK